MVTDFAKLANTILNGTRDKLIEKYIHENVDEIAEELERNGFYVNDDLDFRLEIRSA